ncbi:hypothetical protein N9Z92_02720 [Akkermansiaceae bacterium]|nr:hypothetical protein [bacterium]MDB4572798.1 hypothetical protein [Akkermansiaceae bacterium]
MNNKKIKRNTLLNFQKFYIFLVLISSCEHKGEDVSKTGIELDGEHTGMTKSYLLSESQLQFFNIVEKQTSWSTYGILNCYGIGYVTDNPSDRESFDAVLRDGELIVDGDYSAHEKIETLVESNHLLTLNYWTWLTSNDGTQTYEEWLVEGEGLGD